MSGKSLYLIYLILGIRFLACSGAENQKNEALKEDLIEGYWNLEQKKIETFNDSITCSSRTPKYNFQEVVKIHNSWISFYRYPYMKFFSSRYVFVDSSLIFNDYSVVLEYIVDYASQDSLVISLNKTIQDNKCGYAMEKTSFHYSRISPNKEIIKSLDENQFNPDKLSRSWKLSAVQYPLRIATRNHIQLGEEIDSISYSKFFAPPEKLELSDKKNYSVDGKILNYEGVAYEIIYMVKENLFVKPIELCKCDSICVQYTFAN